MRVRRLLPLLGLALLTGLGMLALSADADSGTAPPKNSADPPGKEDRVKDTVITLKTSYSTIDLHESINNGIDGKSGRYYVAPHFRFLLLGPGKKVIAHPAWAADEGTVPVQMSLEMVHPEIRPEVVRMLRDSGREVTITDVRNLQIDSVRVSINDAYQVKYPVKDFVLTNPQAGAEKLAVTLSVPSKKANEFVELVNKGGVNFHVSYSYNQISLDSRYEMLKASILLDNQQVRDLSQRGAEIMSAKQMAEAAANIKREIESKVIEGIGKIEPQSLPVERLMQFFSVGEMWKKAERQIEEMDQRLLKQFDLGVNAKDFQPFKFQKKVIETLAKETGVANKKKAYFDLFKAEKQGMKVSAGLKIGPFGASGEYSKEFEQKMSMGNMSDDEFREHIKTYHGAEYTTEGVLERGVEVYDVQKVRAMGEMRIISATLKPTMGTGFRSMSLTPNVMDSQWVDRTFVSIEERLRSLDERLKDAKSQLESSRLVFGYWGFDHDRPEESGMVCAQNKGSTAPSRWIQFKYPPAQFTEPPRLLFSATYTVYEVPGMGIDVRNETKDGFEMRVVPYGSDRPWKHFRIFWVAVPQGITAGAPPGVVVK